MVNLTIPLVNGKTVFLPILLEKL